MKRLAGSFLSQISVCTSSISPVACISAYLVSQDKALPTYFKLIISTIDNSSQPLSGGEDGLVPACALFCTVPRVAGIFCCSADC